MVRDFFFPMKQIHFNYLVILYIIYKFLSGIRNKIKVTNGFVEEKESFHSID